jgi:hypothetical protein
VIPALRRSVWATQGDPVSKQKQNNHKTLSHECWPLAKRFRNAEKGVVALNLSEIIDITAQQERQ